MNPFQQHKRRVIYGIGPRPGGKYSHFFHPNISLEELKTLRKLSDNNHEKGALTRAIKEREGNTYIPSPAQKRARAVNYLLMAATGSKGNLSTANYRLMQEATEKVDNEKIYAIRARVEDVLTELDSLIDAIKHNYPPKRKKKDVF